MPRHKNQVNLDSDTKNKSFSTPAQKPSQRPSLHWNRVYSDPPHWNQVNVHHAHKNQVAFDAHTKPTLFGPCTKITSISTAHTQNQINFDAPTKAKSFRDEFLHAWRRSPVGEPPAPRPWSWIDDRTPEPCKRSISSGNATDSSLTFHLVLLQPRRYPSAKNSPRTKNILFEAQNCRY